MQEAVCGDRDWATGRRQLMTCTSELGSWRHLVTSVGSPRAFDVGWRHYLGPPPPPQPPSSCVMDHVGRDWVVRCVSYQQLKQLECRDDATPRRSGTTTNVDDAVSSTRCFLGDSQARRQSIVSVYNALKDHHQLSNGS